MKFSNAVRLLTTAMLLLAGSAFGATVDFDDFTTSAGFDHASSNRYQSLGVIFSREIPIVNLPVGEPGFVTQFTNAGGTLPNALGLFGAIDLTFVVPGTSTPAITDHVRVLFTDSDIGTVSGTMQAFDITGALIASTTLITPPNSRAVLEVTAPGIRRVRLSVDADGADLDNLFFTTPTPACPPASIRVSEVEVCWPSISNTVYQVDYRSAFTTNTWVQLFTNVVALGPETCVTDRIVRGTPQRFYRVVCPMEGE